MKINLKTTGYNLLIFHLQCTIYLYLFLFRLQQCTTYPFLDCSHTFRESDLQLYGVIELISFQDNNL